MKKLALLVSFLFVAAVAVAAVPQKAAQKAAGKTHEMSAEVVSADANAKTLTVKGEAGAANKTVPCEGKAVSSLKTLKAGEKVTLVCRDNEKGEHQAITGIKPAKK